MVGGQVFGSNGIKRTGSPIYVSVVLADVTKAVNDFALTTPVASPANSMKITGNKIEVDAKVKFWSATTGDYYLAAYLIEEGALNAQNGQTTTTGATSHHGVMRGSLSVSSWGDLVATGSIIKDATYDKKFVYIVNEDAWDKTKLKVYTVIWKKVGSTYQFVNASTTEAPTSINSIAGVNELKLFPNPATGENVTLFVQSTESQEINISVVDMMGRIAYTANQNAITVGQNNITIPTSNLAAGNYQVLISSDNGSITEKLSIAK